MAQFRTYRMCLPRTRFSLTLQSPAAVIVPRQNNMNLVHWPLMRWPLPWLPVLSKVELPAQRRKAATDKLIS